LCSLEVHQAGGLSKNLRLSGKLTRSKFALRDA